MGTGGRREDGDGRPAGGLVGGVGVVGRRRWVVVGRCGVGGAGEGGQWGGFLCGEGGVRGGWCVQNKVLEGVIIIERERVQME